MKNLKYIMATLMVALVVAVVCVACNKDKETPVQEANNNSDNEPNTEVVERKPIATMDMKTGEITYSFCMDELQHAICQQLSSKDSNRYYLETVEIVDEIPVEDTIFTGIKIVLLDTDTENSITIWASNTFIEKVVNNTTVNYYLANDVADGNYSFETYGKTNYTVNVENKKLVNIMPCQQPSGPIFCITCTSHLCERGCEPFKMTWTGWTCTECKGTDSGRYCDVTIDYSHILDAIAVAVAIIAIL